MKTLIEEKGFNLGRMVGFSKTLYRQRYPNNEIVFNANIFTKSSGKIWWGDLDLTLDEEKLKEISKEMGEPLYILREMDGRFENESLNFEEVEQKAIKIINV